MESEQYYYDVVLSFAGEKREFVEAVAKVLEDNDIKFFYDRNYEVESWGKDLTEETDFIYRKQAKYGVLFISKGILNIWPRLEIRSMLARALYSPEEYILPARFDDTEIPGLRPTIKYIDLNNHTPETFADLIIQKVKKGEIKKTRPVDNIKESRQIVGPKVGYDLSLEILTLCYTMRDEIKNCQHPFISVAELSQREKDGKKEKRETSQQSEVLDSWYASFKRYEKIIEIKKELDKLKIKTEILFGIESREKIEELYSVVRRLGVAIQSYHENKLYDRQIRDRVNHNIINGINPYDYPAMEENKDYNNDGGFEEWVRSSVKKLTDHYKDKMSEFRKLMGSWNVFTNNNYRSF